MMDGLLVVASVSSKEIEKFLFTKVNKKEGYKSENLREPIMLVLRSCVTSCFCPKDGVGEQLGSWTWS